MVPAFKNRVIAEMRPTFQAIANDAATPVNVGNRARIMLDLLTSNAKG